MIKRARFLKLLAAAAVIPRLDGSDERLTEESIEKAFRKGMTTLNRVFWAPEIGNWLDRPGKNLRGHFDGYINPPWWSCANAVETMVEFMELTQSKEYDQQIRELHDANVLRGSWLPKLAASLKKSGDWKEADEEKLSQKLKKLDPKKIHGSEFRNEYLDDSAWWGIAWLAFYERTKEPRYLKSAITIQEHMANSWQESGGVSWGEESDKRDPNSITNSLFVVLSARLFRVTRQQKYLRWAERTLAWEKEAKLYDGIAIVDRPGHQGDYWTYNQGAYVGGLDALFHATRKKEYLDEAAQVAGTILSKSGIVLENGVLYEKLGTDGWDVSLFKGVCARYFGTLSRTLRKEGRHLDAADQLDRVLRSSAAEIVKLPMKDGLYPLEWQESPRAEVYNFNTQLSALTALVAAIPAR